MIRFSTEPARENFLVNFRAEAAKTLSTGNNPAPFLTAVRGVHRFVARVTAGCRPADCGEGACANGTDW